MLNYHNKTLTKIISLILTQIFLVTSLVYPETNLYKQYTKLSVNLSSIKDVYCTHIQNKEVNWKLRNVMMFAEGQVQGGRVSRVMRRLLERITQKKSGKETQVTTQYRAAVSNITVMSTFEHRLDHSLRAIYRLVEDFKERAVVYDIGIGWSSDRGPVTTKELAGALLKKAEVIGIDTQIPSYIIYMEGRPANALLFDENDNLLFISSPGDDIFETGQALQKQDLQRGETRYIDYVKLAKALKKKAIRENRRELTEYMDGQSYKIIFNPVQEHRQSNLEFQKGDLFNLNEIYDQVPKAHIVRIANLLMVHYEPSEITRALKSLFPMVHEGGYVLIGYSDPKAFQEEEYIVYRKKGNSFVLERYMFSTRSDFIHFGVHSDEYNTPLTTQHIDGKLFGIIESSPGWETLRANIASNKTHLPDYAKNRESNDKALASMLAEGLNERGITAEPLGSMVSTPVQSPEETQDGLAKDLMQAVKAFYIDRGAPIEVLIEPKTQLASNTVLAAGKYRKPVHTDVHKAVEYGLPEDLRNFRDLSEADRKALKDKYRDRNGQIVIPIKSLLLHTGLLGHIGLGQYYGEPVIYVDAALTVYGKMDVKVHELDEIHKWEAKREELGLDHRQMRVWIRENSNTQGTGLAQELAKRWHAEAPSIDHIYKLPQYRFLVQQGRAMRIGARIFEAAKENEKEYKRLFKEIRGMELEEIVSVPVMVKTKSKDMASAPRSEIELLLEFAESLNDDELASIIAHEFTHVQEKIQRKRNRVTLKEMSREGVEALLQTNEYLADELAVFLAAKAMFDPNAAESARQKAQVFESPNLVPRELPDYEIHPPPEERAQRLREYALTHESYALEEIYAEEKDIVLTAGEEAPLNQPIEVLENRVGVYNIRLPETDRQVEICL